MSKNINYPSREGVQARGETDQEKKGEVKRNGERGPSRSKVKKQTKNQKANFQNGLNLD